MEWILLTWTSSSFLTGIDLTPYLVRSSLERGADISRRLRICLNSAEIFVSQQICLKIVSGSHLMWEGA